MSSRWYTLVIDSTDPARLARWWAQVLDYQVVYEAPDEVVIERDGHTNPALSFAPVPEGKTSRTGCTLTSTRTTRMRRSSGSRAWARDGLT